MLKIENVSKRFWKKIVLSDVSCQFENGVYGMLGPNGAGKTTLIKCILGLYEYQTGKITLEAGGETSQVIGYLPQKSGALPELSVEEQLK